MGIGTITVPAAGSVTAPTDGLSLPSPTVSSIKTGKWAPCSVVDLPELRGVMFADGVSPLRHVVTNVLRTGPLAPSAAPTVAWSGAQATAVLTFTGQPADGETITELGKRLTGGLAITNIVYKTTLVVDGTGGWQVLRGADLAASIANTKKLINNTGTHGVDYWNLDIANGAYPYDPGTNYDIEVSATTGTTVTFRALTGGTGGNLYYSTESGGSMSFAATRFTGGAAPTGTDPASGTYQYAYAHYRSEDGCQTAIGDVAEVTIPSNGNVALSVLAAAVDTDPDTKRWFRTMAGGTLFWRGYDIAEADTTDTDDISDTLDVASTATTTLDRFGNVIYDPSAHRPYEGGYPPRVRYLARHKGRIFGAGAVMQATLTPTLGVTVGSDTATVAAGEPDDSWAGRVITSPTQGLEYLIVRVDASGAGTLYLDRPWEGATNAGLAVTLKDGRDPYELHYTEPMLPNNWPVANSVRGVIGPANVGVTGLVEAWESLVIFTINGVWRLTGDGPESFQLHHDVKGIGCVGGRTIQMVDGVLYWLGADGVYAWPGEGTPYKVSSPPARQGGEVSGIDRTLARLNLAVADGASSHYDPETRLLRWYVPLDTDVTNRWALVLDVQTGAWSLDTVEDVVSAATVVRQSGDRVTLTGDIQGQILHVDVSNSDGAYGFEAVETTDTGGTVRTIEIPAADTTWASATLTGLPVWVVDSSGNFTRHRIASNDGNTLTLARCMSAALASGVTIVVGGIHMHVETGRFNLGDPVTRKTLAAMDVAFDVDVDGQVYLATGVDQTTPSVRSGATSFDLTSGDGEVRMKVQKYGTSHRFALHAIEPGCDPHLWGYRLDMRYGD